jgi:hypothetical protein
VPPRLGVRADNQVGSLAEAKQQLRRAWEAVRTAARCFDRADLVPKETIRFWRVSLQRQRTQVLGSVKARDEKAAQAEAIAQFNLNEE